MNVIRKPNALNAYSEGFQTSWFSDFLFDLFIRNRMNSVWGWLLLSGIMITVSAGVAIIGPMLGIFIIALVIGGPLVFSTLLSLKTGVYLIIGISFSIGVVIMAFPSLQIGLLVDLLILFMFLGLVYRSYKSKDWSSFKTPVSVVILIWIIYNLLQIANPGAASRIAWFYVVRPAVGYILLFFMTYAFIRTKNEIKNLLTFITILLLITSFWGIMQFFNGYLSFEMAYVMANDAVHLVYINGRWRSFGTMISPAQYGIVVAYLMVLVFILASRKMSFFLKMIYLGAGFAALFAMVYSGTRSAYVVVPLALITLVILGKNLKLYFIGAGFAVLFLVLIVTPSNNYQIQRIQSAFNGEHDESYMVRKRNQEMIRPWILAHPLGGGLGSTGVWGQKFSPGTFLANFPPDSGYVRVAVELGWIGLIIYLIMIGKIMISGVFAYWKMTDPELKKIVLAILSMLAAISVVEYAQEVINKLPTNMLFWIFLGILFKSIQIEKTEQQAQLLIVGSGKVESK